MFPALVAAKALPIPNTISTFPSPASPSKPPTPFGLSLLKLANSTSSPAPPHYPTFTTPPTLSSQGPLEPVYRAALALGTANQLTNILRDVGEDAYQRNRIYVPLDELDKFGIAEKEVRCARGQKRSSWMG